MINCAFEMYLILAILRRLTLNLRDQWLCINNQESHYDRVIDLFTNTIDLNAVY